MAMMPKRVKYRKKQRGRIKGEAQRGNAVAFGEYGLQCLDQGRISARQIEAGRIGSSHYLKGEGRIWIRVFPHKSMTSTPAETRMGKGKGEIDFWCAVVKPGTILYEIGGVPEETAKTALLRTAHKLPVRCRFVKRRHKV
ncbi:MAG: 50S ribosomal protein L16 [Planctomycetes bacterium]|nr:50S ribosomal protein L16 [Planctomycetota bacterium]